MNAKKKDLHKMFSNIVMGAVIATTSGCSDCVCEDTSGPVSYGVPLTDTTPEYDAVLAEDLEAFLAENPDATADQQLTHLYASGGGYVGTINEQVRELIDQASMAGGISVAACEGLCGAFYALQVDSCEAPDAQASGTDVLLCDGTEFRDCGGAGRLPHGIGCEPSTTGTAEGRWWAHIAYLEKAAVHAFVQLAGELRELGAPADLVDRCISAAIDEVGHARLTSELAVQLGTQPSVVEVDVDGPRALFELALQNATEGCVRETFAGLEATWQAQHCAPEYQALLHQIAEEECGHAELSWDIQAWAQNKLTAAQNQAIAHAQDDALAALRTDVTRRQNLGVPSSVGLPNGQQARALLDQMQAALN